MQNNERPSKLPTQASLQQPANLSSKVKKSSSGVKIALLSLLSLASIVVIVLALPNLLRQNNGGSTSTNLDRQRTLSSLATGSISNTTWKDQTLALLEKTHAWSGSYTGNLATASSAYDSYTTYYTVLAYKELGSPIPNADATVKAIKASQGTDGSFLCEKPTVGKTEPQIDRIGCIHYAVMTLDALGTRPNDVQAVIQHINALQSNAGVYAFNTDVLNQINASSPDINRDILATRQALTVLETLGGQPQRSESLKNWLLSQWNNDALFTEAVSHKQKLSTLLGVGESLERLAMKLRDLSNAPARLTWAKSLRGTVLDLRAGGQKTNLMLIADWLDLTQRLSGDEKNGNLLDATFFDQLTKLQQTSGGFNALLSNDPDIKGTYLAVKLFKEAAHNVPQAKNIHALLNRQALDQGGFLPVFQVRYNSPAFTNISLDVRAFLGVGPENDATLKAFARNSMAELLKSSSQTIPPKPGDAKTLYDTVILARRTGLDTALLTPILNQQATALVDGLKDKQPLDGTQLTEAYYLTQLVQFEAPVVSKLERNLLLMRNQIGAFGANGRYNLQYTWLALSTLDNLKSSVLSMQARKQSAAWIRQHQTTDGGYKEAGIVNVYSSYWAVDSLRVLEGKVRPDSKLIDWLRALKQPGGGIKPTPDPISGSDLTATYYALKVAQWMGFTLLS